MTGWGASPTPQPEPGGNTIRNPTLGDAIRKGFRELMKTLTRPKPIRKPKARGGAGDIGRMLVTVGRRLTRHVAWPVLNSYGRIGLPDWDAMAWIDRWGPHCGVHEHFDSSYDSSIGTGNNCDGLSPHP